VCYENRDREQESPGPRAGSQDHGHRRGQVLIMFFEFIGIIINFLTQPLMKLYIVIII
jgi:hypothetical protein